LFGGCQTAALVAAGLERSIDRVRRSMIGTEQGERFDLLYAPLSTDLDAPTASSKPRTDHALPVLRR
jgi:hypothetical protein